MWFIWTLLNYNMLEDGETLRVTLLADSEGLTVNYRVMRVPFCMLQL